MKAVILAGGLGTRLRPLTNNTPKPMLPVGEKPILEHLINWTKKNGVKSIVLCVSYLRETIEDYFEDGEKFGVKIEYAISKIKKLKLTIYGYDRKLEPKNVKIKGSTIEWGIKKAMKDAKKSPDVIYHKGDFGKEPMIILFGETPNKVIKKIMKII